MLRLDLDGRQWMNWRWATAAHILGFQAGGKRGKIVTGILSALPQTCDRCFILWNISQVDLRPSAELQLSELGLLQLASLCQPVAWVEGLELTQRWAACNNDVNISGLRSGKWDAGKSSSTFICPTIGYVARSAASHSRLPQTLSLLLQPPARARKIWLRKPRKYACLSPYCQRS